MKIFLKTTLFILIISIFSGCGLQKMWKDMLIQRTLTKEALVEYKPEGAFLFGTVDKGKDTRASGIMLMLMSAPDLFLPIKDFDVTSFLVDVPFDSEGVNKFGIRYNFEGSVLDQWVMDTYKFTLLTNAIKAVTNERVTILNRVENGKMVSVTNRAVTIETIPQVYYFGRIKIMNVEGMFRDSYKIQLTNMIDVDQKRFVELYPILTNADFIVLDPKIVKY
jgi:hypothetical protein